jgi:hypothetical protein
LRHAAAGLALALAACGAPDERSDWERAHEARLAAEPTAVLPPYPRPDRLIEFEAGAASPFRFFVDGASLTLGPDKVVRYTMVARSAAGAQTVTYEGMRCQSGEVRLYAVGRDGAWAGRPGPWRPIDAPGVQRWHKVLFREYFCPQREPITSAGEGVDALRRGGHPLAKDFSSDQPRAR